MRHLQTHIHSRRQVFQNINTHPNINYSSAKTTFPKRCVASNSSNTSRYPSLTKTSIPELNLIPNIASNKKDPLNHSIHDWRNSCNTHLRINRIAHEKNYKMSRATTNHLPKYSSAKIIVRKEKLTAVFINFTGGQHNQRVLTPITIPCILIRDNVRYVTMPRITYYSRL